MSKRTEKQKTQTGKEKQIMMYCGNKAKVFHNGKWSPFMAIEEAKRFERQMRVAQIAAQIEAGNTVIVMRGEQALLEEARKAAAR